MNATEQQAVIDFYCYPPIGPEDWRYTYQTATVRVLETQMLTRGTMLDIANAASFEDALELLAGSEYAVPSTTTVFSEIEKMLLEKRTETRKLFADTMLDQELVELLHAREDFANMRLAIRRVVTERPIGLDYSNDGSVPAEEFEEIFEQENYSRFPVYLQEAVEDAILGYYENKDIRQIDYAIDRSQAAYKLRRARELNSVFLTSLFRTQVDLTNIRTSLRMKLAEMDRKDAVDHILPGGFIEADKFLHIFDIGYEAIGSLFYATPYHQTIEAGVSYLTAQKSFLRLEEACEDHMAGFLKTTSAIAAGPQPVIAYFMMKEGEIRTVRMLLTCKKNSLDTKMILDRLGEG